MATKGRPKSAEKKQQIIQASADLFMKHGFDGVSMDMVADAAGVSKQTVYSHFGNKDDLYRETISGKCTEHGVSPEFLQDDKPCADMLLEIANRFTSLLMSKEAIYMYRLSAASAGQHQRVSQLFYEAGPNRTIETVAGYLAKQHEKRILNIPNPRQAACQFLYMLKGDAISRAVFNIDEKLTAKEIESYKKSCVDVFLKAYAN